MPANSRDPGLCATLACNCLETRCFRLLQCTGSLTMVAQPTQMLSKAPVNSRWFQYGSHIVQFSQMSGCSLNQALNTAACQDSNMHKVKMSDKSQLKHYMK